MHLKAVVRLASLQQMLVLCGILVEDNRLCLEDIDMLYQFGLIHSKDVQADPDFRVFADIVAIRDELLPDDPATNARRNEAATRAINACRRLILRFRHVFPDTNLSGLAFQVLDEGVTPEAVEFLERAVSEMQVDPAADQVVLGMCQAQLEAVRARRKDIERPSVGDSRTVLARKQNRRRYTYRITDRASCEAVIRVAVVFWAMLTIVGPILTVINLLHSEPAPDRGVAALLNLIPLAFSVLIAMLAWRVHHDKSRVASTILYAIFIGSVAFCYLRYGFVAASGSGLALGLQMYLGFIFFLGMRGTYLWHSTYRDAPQSPEPARTEEEWPANSLGPDEQGPPARSRDDLCPACLEFFEASELTCRFCGTALVASSSAAHTLGKAR